MKTLYYSHIPTHIGKMIALSDDHQLYLLEFSERKNLKRNLERFSTNIEEGRPSPIISIEEELERYFARTLKEFKTPICTTGTDFQKQVWQELSKIPMGATKSYKEVAYALNKPKSFRAVAQANASNQFAILIPCHRVINSDGKLGGYAAGIFRKKWLLQHEKSG